MARLSTLLLDRTAWDLVLDSAGNIAMAAPPYALTQDVASAVQLYIGELWFQGNLGIPYFEQVLGQLPPLSLLTGLIEKAAMTVSGVVAAQCVIASFDSRQISGEIRFIDETGAALGVSF